MRTLWLMAVVVLGLTLCLPAAADAQGTAPTAAAAVAPVVWVTEARGVIDPPLADYLEKTIRRANETGVQALVIEMDTPGGLDSSMRDIIQAEIDSEVPVVIYVYPQGSRAASAGVYIMMGSDVAAMAPQTNLGSAQPVAMNGELDEEMKKKVVNDAAAYMRGLAANNGRNVNWAEEAVRESVSLTSEEALQQGVIDFVAGDVDALLAQIDGYTTVAKQLTLVTAGADVERVGMSWWENLLHVVANPEIAYILLLIGIYGIIFELQSPGVGVGGVVGGLSLLLALYGLQVLPVNFLGIALILIAVGLFVAEAFIQSYGLLGIAGTVALVFGGLLLFDTEQPFFRVDWYAIAIAATVSVVFFGIVLRAVIKARRASPTTGNEGVAGCVGRAAADLVPEGFVMARGELWKAILEDWSPGAEPVREGQEVDVVGLDGLTLRVRRCQRSEATDEAEKDLADGPN